MSSFSLFIRDHKYNYLVSCCITDLIIKIIIQKDLLVSQKTSFVCQREYLFPDLNNGSIV